MSKHKGKIIIAVLILSTLALTFLWEGGYFRSGQPHVQGSLANKKIGEEYPRQDFIGEELISNPKSTIGKSDKNEGFLDKDDGLGEKAYQAEKAENDIDDDNKSIQEKKPDTLTRDEKPNPVEPQDTTIEEIAYTCILSVKCDTILDNMDYLAEEKLGLVPGDGIIFKAREVVFYEGESVFNLLQREMKKNKIHMEFRNVPVYNSAYILAINNIYEFDVGQLSGWVYKVNDWFPNYGVSRYKLEEGDIVEFVYTCDLGRDTGGYNDLGGQ